ncbi:MAG: acyl-CoA dehydrogenase family protein [Candidatus Eremiobacteraeota bacterium]|nr:acyl-CoA dehydrogenase family protein [Candidatus Eremiobacteraeota bacterium]
MSGTASGKEKHREGPIAGQLPAEIAAQGCLGAPIPEEYGGKGLDMRAWGRLCEAAGKISLARAGLYTVHGMVSRAILRWGTAAQRERWLPLMAKGKVIGAFALSEAQAGSDAGNVETAAARTGNSYSLTGVKKWVSFGEAAGVTLVIARTIEGLSAFLVEKDTPGLTCVTINGMLGMRESMLSELHLAQAIVPGENLLGAEGFGFSAVAQSALDFGRYSVAWASLGIARACLEETIALAAGSPGSRGNSLIEGALAEMAAEVEAAGLLCLKAGFSREHGDPASIRDACMAKYFASRTAMKCADDALRLSGLAGCSSGSPLERYFRDAKALEIIEGTSQVLEILIGSSSSFFRES